MEEKNEKLCPNCQTGANSIKLDPKEPMCPYMYLYGNNGCTGFVRMNGGDKK